MRVEYAYKHLERDQDLPNLREALLENVLADLTEDENVLAIYLAGSLGRGDFDRFSDIDLHVIVAPEMKQAFIKNKRKRASNWGNVLFYEGGSEESPVVVSHFDCFIKVDSWYKTLDEVVPSVWLKGIKPLYDPSNILASSLEEIAKLPINLEQDDVSFWKTKVLAFLHETYRASMRHEMYYALSNLDRVRWLIADGWYMEMDKHLDSSYGVWSKVEGDRSQLQDWQLSLLASWACGRDSGEIMQTIESMYPELLRLNKVLCQKVDMDNEEETFKRIIHMVI